jgi:phosphocarrier protein
MRQFTAILTFEHGLHGRPAAELMRLAQQFQSEITISDQGHSASAKGLIGLMSLCAQPGDPITVTADGPDEDQAISRLEQFFQTNT